MQSYNFILIFVVVFFLYFFSLFLVKFQKITQFQHRRFWNLVLLVTFLVTGIFGLFLAFSIDQKLSLRWYLPLIWYHVEFGIIMALISLFHIIWHLPYFSSIFKQSINSKK